MKGVNDTVKHMNDRVGAVDDKIIAVVDGTHTFSINRQKIG